MLFVKFFLYVLSLVYIFVKFDDDLVLLPEFNYNKQSVDSHIDREKQFY